MKRKIFRIHVAYLFKTTYQIIWYASYILLKRFNFNSFKKKKTNHKPNSSSRNENFLFSSLMFLLNSSCKSDNFFFNSFTLSLVLLSKCKPKELKANLIK